MSKHNTNCRTIAAVLFALVASAFLAISYAKQHATKDEFVAYQARRYNLFIQNPSVLRALQVAISNVSNTTLLYELLSKL